MSVVSTELSNLCFPKIDSSTEFASDDSRFLTVGKKPGIHNILSTENFEEAAIFPSLESDTDEYDIENESVINITDLESSSNENCKEIKTGTLKRILRNFTRSSKSELPIEETAKVSSSEPDIEEVEANETNENKVSESTTKGSKTNISKAFQRLSGALSRSKIDKEKDNSSKQDLREEKDKRNSLSRRLSNISAHLIKSDKEKDNNSKHDLIEKDKRNSLSRRLSNISSHLPRLSSHKVETTSLDNPTDGSQSDSNRPDSEDTSASLKRCPSDKSSTLGRRLSGIGSHFRFLGVSNPGSGEAGNLGDTTKIEKNSLELEEKKEIG